MSGNGPFKEILTLQSGSKAVETMPTHTAEEKLQNESKMSCITSDAQEAENGS